MFNRKNELLDYIEQLQGEFNKAVNVVPLLLSDSQEVILNMGTLLRNKIETGELLVPVIGGFSAGKSTAINQLIGRNVLPVAITAETSLPAEIRYNEEEYLLAFNINGEEERYPLSELSELSKNAAHYDVIKVFVDSQAIKNLEPFTLVDMPGFDSSLEQHNNAILRYLNRGAFYLYLVSAQNGSLHIQDIRRLNEILESNRLFSVFITKKDLFSDTDLINVKNHMNEQIICDFDVSIHVDCIDTNNTFLLVDELNKTDPDQLFNNQFICFVKEFYYSIDANINNTILALTNNKKDNIEQIAKLKKILLEIEEEKEQRLQSIDSSISINFQKRILMRMNKELNNSIHDLVSAAKMDSNSLSRNISDIVRTILVNELKVVTKQISESVIDDFSSLLNVNVNTDLNLSADWMNNLIDNLQTEVMNALVGFIDRYNKSDSESKEITSKLLELLSRAAVFIPQPMIKIALTILPGIVDNLFKSIKESRENEHYRKTIQENVIPSVIEDMASEVSSAIENIKQCMVIAISEQFSQKIKEQKDILEKAQENCDAQYIDIEKNINLLQSISKNINLITEKNII